MTYEITPGTSAGTPLASIRERVEPKDLSTRIPALCGEVFGWVRQQLGQGAGGRMVAIYRHPPGATAFEMEVGVEVQKAPTGDGRVAASALPSGRIASTVHLGDYGKLGEAHEALLAWARAHGHQPSVTWEVYGHWTEDPAQLRTDVFVLLD